MKRIFLVVMVIVLSSAQTLASPQTPEDTNTVVPEMIVEARAKDIGRKLRCVVCQNQSIDESDATLAEDMRKIVREHIRAGQTDAQIIAFMQERYGDFVLLKPPVQENTWFLWFAPGGLVFLLLLWYIRRGRKPPITQLEDLSANERAEIERILNGDKDGDAR